MMKYLFLLSMVTLTAYAALNDVDKQDIYPKSILTNGGFENGKGAGVGKWTASAGTFNITITGSNLLSGKASATWDAAASNDTLSSFAVTIPAGLYSNNGVAFCRVMTPSGTATHKLEVFDGSLTIASQSITSSTLPLLNAVNFIFPSSGTVSLRLLAQADEPSITVDDCYLGPAAGVNISNISQATFVGSAYFATTTNCAGWSRTNTALGAFASDSDCPGPTVEVNAGPGVIQTTDADLPKITVNNMPPGNYEVWVSVPTLKDGTGNPCTFTLNDGTTSSGRGNCGSTASAADGVTFAGHFNYTTAANHTFEVYGASGSGAIAIDNSISNKSLQFWIYRFPTSYDQGYRPSQVPFFYEGRHESNCAWTRNNTAYGDPAGDASCSWTEYKNVNAGSVTSAMAGALTFTPGFTITLPRTSTYEACASFRSGGDTTGAANAYQLLAGTTTIAQRSQNEPASGGLPMELCGWHTPTSAGTSTTFSIQMAASSGTGAIQANTTYHYTIRWTIRDLLTPMATPYLVNSVTNTANGVTGIEAAKLNCDAGSSIMSQQGTWVSSIGNISGGACAVTLTTGTFSATPYCTATPATAGGYSTGLELNVDATSATAVSVDCEDDASTACSAVDFILHCVGAK
jgi:hypothetical protein